MSGLTEREVLAGPRGPDAESPLIESLCRLFCEAEGIDPDAPPKAGKPAPAWRYEADYAREAMRLVLAFLEREGAPR